LPRGRQIEFAATISHDEHAMAAQRPRQTGPEGQGYSIAALREVFHGSIRHFHRKNLHFLQNSVTALKIIR
jgi:hypothetical protein